MAVAGGVVWTLVSRENEKQQQAMARDSMARRELTLLAEALERFNADLGRYPTSEEGISLLHRRPASKVLAQWAGPYVDGIYEVDPWGSDYVYRPTPDARQFELFTYGPAGAEAGQVYLSVTSTR
jgi:general secretion pathway protein G